MIVKCLEFPIEQQCLGFFEKILYKELIYLAFFAPRLAYSVKNTNQNQDKIVLVEVSRKRDKRLRARKLIRNIEKKETSGKNEKRKPFVFVETAACAKYVFK